MQEQRTVDEELSRATDALAEHRTNEETGETELRRLDDLSARSTEALKTKRTELAAVQSLSESFASWEGNRARLTAVVESERAAVNY